METQGERNRQRNIPFSVTEHGLLTKLQGCFKKFVLKFGNYALKLNSVSQRGCFQILESRTLSDIFYLFWQMQRILVVGSCSYLLFFFLREKEMLALVCTQREQNKREQRKCREGVTDSGNGRLGPEEKGLYWFQHVKPFTEGSKDLRAL